MLTCDAYVMPETLEDALDLWSGAPAGSRLVAGATDLLPWAREGRAGDVHLPLLIDLSRIGALDGYALAGDRIRLGANLVFQRFLSDAGLKRHLPAMPHCAIWFADDQIRAQATLAGNLVNASPAADGMPPLLAANAAVEIAGLKDGAVATRSLALADFVTGPGKTVLEPGEIVTAIACDNLEGYGGSFEKVGQRRSLVISVVCAAACVRVSEDGSSFADVRLALGGTGPVPERLHAIEDYLKGRKIAREAIDAASRMSDGLVRSRTRQAYRRSVVEGFIARALEDALMNCAAGPVSDVTAEDAIHA